MMASSLSINSYQKTGQKMTPKRSFSKFATRRELVTDFKTLRNVILALFLNLFRAIFKPILFTLY